MALKTSSLMLHGLAKLLLAALIALFTFSVAVTAFVGFVPSGHDGSRATYTWLSDDLAPELITAVAWGVSLMTLRFIMVGAMVGAFVLAAIFFIQLYRIVRSSESGEPFTAANARRLASMGWILLAPVAVVVAVRLASMRPLDFGETVNLSLFTLAGLVILILADVFRRGAAMREDLAGTV